MLVYLCHQSVQKSFQPFVFSGFEVFSCSIRDMNFEQSAPFQTWSQKLKLNLFFFPDKSSFLCYSLHHNLETSGPRIPLVRSFLSFVQGRDVDRGFLEPPKDNFSSFLLGKNFLTQGHNPHLFWSKW